MFEIIPAFLIAAASIVATVCAFVVVIKNTIKNKNWAHLLTIAQGAMSAAEEEAKKRPSMTSDDKLEFALAAIEGACKAANIKLDSKALDDLVAYIKQMCAWAKTVNAGKTTKK